MLLRRDVVTALSADQADTEQHGAAVSALGGAVNSMTGCRAGLSALLGGAFDTAEAEAMFLSRGKAEA